MRRNILSITLMLCVVSPAYADSKAELDKEVGSTLSKCQAEIKGCKDLTSNASGVLVFPQVTKGGVGAGYETGKGALVEKGKTVGYYKTNSASLGATVGVGRKAVVVVFKTPAELEKFKKSSGWEAGADAAIAMLETGAGAMVDTNTIKESVVGIVFSESGALADVSIKGSKISALDANELG